MQEQQERFIDARELAAMIGVSRTTIWRWRRDGGKLPEPIRFSDTVVRWRLSDIMAMGDKAEA